MQPSHQTVPLALRRAPLVTAIDALPAQALKNSALA
jgi:hypothetical protein